MKLLRHITRASAENTFLKKEFIAAKHPTYITLWPTLSTLPVRESSLGEQPLLGSLPFRSLHLFCLLKAEFCLANCIWQKTTTSEVLGNILEYSGSKEWECCLIRKSCGESGMFANVKMCNQYCSEGVLTDAHQSTRLTNKQSWAWSVATFDLFHCNYSRPGAPGEPSGQSFLGFLSWLKVAYLFGWVRGITIMHSKLPKEATGEDLLFFPPSFVGAWVKLNPSKSLFFFFFFFKREVWKAADIWVMLKSHYKVVIQSKHLCCTDRNAAVDGCKLIMIFDSPVLELMMHLLKPFNCFCWAVKRRRKKKKALQFSWLNWEAPLKMSSDGWFPPGQQKAGSGYLHFPKLEVHKETGYKQSKISSEKNVSKTKYLFDLGLFIMALL